MNTERLILESKNCKAVNIGLLYDLFDYSYLDSRLGTEIRGKVFLGEKLKTTGAEISFQILPPQTSIPFSHYHIENEEIYIFLKGKGEFQVDNDRFSIEEGSVIRVSPEGRRTWKNTSASLMIFIVIQVKENSLDKFYNDDGVKVE